MQHVSEFCRERGLRTFDEFMDYDVTTIRSYRTIMPDTLVYSEAVSPQVGFGFALGFPEATQGFTRTVNAPEQFSGLPGWKKKSQLKGLLRDAWNIHNTDDFRDAFAFLVSGEDTSARLLYDRLAAGKIPSELRDSPLLPSRMPQSLDAWDHRRVATLAYIGCSLGLVDVYDVEEEVAETGRRARTAYSSWREFNEAYHSALVLHSEGAHVAWMNMLYLNYFERVDSSPWVQLEF